MNNLPKNTRAANDNQWIFYRRLQDIDIFVEDESLQELYDTLIKRLEVFDGECRFLRVFPLHGKASVFDKAKELDTTRKRAFIVDGDFDFLLISNPLNDPRIFMHPCYCIENYFFCKEAAFIICDEEFAGKVTKKAQRLLEKSFENSNGMLKLVELCIEYAVSESLGLPLPTVNRKKIDKLICVDTSGQVELDPGRISCIQQEVVGEIITQVGEDEYKTTRQTIETAVNALSDSRTIVSGKTFLIPFLRLRLNKVCKRIFETDTLSYKLSKHFNLDNVRELKCFLVQIANA